MRVQLFLALLSGVNAFRSVIIGDSLFWSGPLFWGGQPSPLSKWLETWANHPIENHALVGASLDDGWVKSIRAQYSDVDPYSPQGITTLIMDGGGNDVISHREDCEQWNDNCRSTIQKSVNIAASLFDQAHQEGVLHVLYLGFYYVDGLKEAVDYGNTEMAKLCASAPLPCVFIDPRFNETAGTGLPTPGRLGPDGVHPDPEGYKMLAQMIWEASLTHDLVI